MLAVTSANISGGLDCITAAQVLEQLGGRIDGLLDGGTCPGGVSSTVVDATLEPVRILRQGGTPVEALREVVEIAAGVDEPARHDHWLDAQSMDGYLERSVHRQAWFEALPPPLQQAHAAAWARHRARFGISRGTVLAQSRREHADLLPSGRAVRDEAFTRAQSTLPGLDAERAG